MLHFSVWKTGWSNKQFVQFNWPAEQTNTITSPEKCSMLPRGGINQTDAYLLCHNTCPWLQTQADLEYEGRKPNSESPLGSEKAKENIWGEENERRQCICSGLEETTPNKNVTILHVHWQSRGTSIARSAAQHILGIAVLFNLCRVSLQSSFPTPASSLQEAGQDTPALHSQELRAWATSYSGCSQVFCSGCLLLTLHGPVEGRGAAESP